MDHETRTHSLALDDDHFEHGLFVITALLIGIGVVMVYSATVHNRLTLTGDTRFLNAELSRNPFSGWGISYAALLAEKDARCTR